MKNFALKTFALVLFVSTLFACSSDDESETIITKNELVTAVTGSDTAAINEDVTFQVSFDVENSCGNFHQYLETISGNTKTIQVQTKYRGTNCGATASTKTEPYTFRLNTAGTYVFKFKSSATAFITKTVVIE